MKGKASVKVPGGKLVRVETVYSDRFEEVSITGDFFLEPPEALEELERAVEGVSTDSSAEELVDRLSDVDAELIGFSRETIIQALQEASSE